MAAAYRSSTSATGFAAGLAVNKPAGTIDGDALAVLVDSAGDTGITAPAGWTLQLGPTTLGAKKLRVYTKIASSEPATWTFTAQGGGSVTLLQAVAVSGASVALDVSATNTGSGTAVTYPSVNTTAFNDLLIVFAVNGSTAGHSPGAGLTEAQDTNFEAALSYGPGPASPGASGTKSGTLTNSAAWWAATLAFKESVSVTNIDAVPAASSWPALAPSLSSGVNVDAVPAASSWSFRMPGVGGEVPVVITPPPATSSWTLSTPTVGAASVMQVLVSVTDRARSLVTVNDHSRTTVHATDSERAS